jgi:tyrosyl-tRNA synthetase
MSISDTLMIRFYELLSRKGHTYIDDVKKRLQAGTLHPMEAKKSIAQEIVEQYWGESEAKAARLHFEETFSNRKVPTDLPMHTVHLDAQGRVNIIDVCMDLGYSQTRSEVRRLLKQKGLHLDSKSVEAEWITLEKGRDYLFKQGKLKMTKLRVE